MYTTLIETTPLESGVENVFLTLIRQKPYRFTNALDCIANRINKVPSDEVLSSILFDILMNRECNKRDAIAANRYLNNTLTIYPPSDSSRRLFYKTALTGRRSSGFTSLWSVFRCIVESSFIYYKLYRIGEDEESNLIPYPNCDVLIDFYVRVLTESYDYLCSERVFYEGTEKSLVMELFWPTESANLSAAKENPRQFLEWINDIYRNSARISKIYAFTNLQKLLNLMVKCITHVEYNMDKTVISTNVPDTLFCSSICLLDIVKVIFNTCKEAFNSHENLRRFMHHISPKALQFKLCEYKMYELINSRQPSDRKFFPSTLHTIVTAYMLPTKLNIVGKGKSKKQKGSREEEPGKKKKISPFMSKTINKDKSKQKLNFGATDEEGLTSLHIAVQKNSIDITRQILRKGGTKLLDAKDKNGKKPSHYSSSREMKEVLKEFQLETDTDKSEIQPLKTVSFSNLDIPPFKNYKEYALFCHCLHFLLNYYVNIYNLHHVRRLINNENSSLVEVLKHEDKKCPHFIECGENAVCSEDFECLKILPDIVNHFVKRMSKHTMEKELNFDLELLPFKMFASVLHS